MRTRLQLESQTTRLTRPMSRWITAVSPVASWFVGSTIGLLCSAQP